MASNYQVKVRAIVDSSDIQKQLGKIQVEPLKDVGKLQQTIYNGSNKIKQTYVAQEGALKRTVSVVRDITTGEIERQRVMERQVTSATTLLDRFMGYGALFSIFNSIKNAISGMIENVTSLDSSLVELQKVTDLSGKSLENFTTRAYEAGSQIARTGQEVIDAAAIFSRSGYNIQEAFDLSKVALVMMNVGDGINSVDEAATSLISVLKGYNMEASQAAEVTDLINEISNNAAINFEDLTEGLTRTSAVFNQAGVSIDKTSALLTGTNEILQNVEKSSTGLVTISQRWIVRSPRDNLGAYVQKCA